MKLPCSSAAAADEAAATAALLLLAASRFELRSATALLAADARHAARDEADAEAALAEEDAAILLDQA